MSEKRKKENAPAGRSRPTERSKPPKGPKPDRGPTRPRDSGVMAMRCDNWMYGSSWGNNGLQDSYLHEVSSFPLLTQEKEAECTRRFGEARSQMRDLVEDFPQVIFAKIRVLAEGAGEVRLSNYMDLELDENNVYSNDTVEQLSLNALKSLMKHENAIIDEIAGIRREQRRDGQEQLQLDLTEVLAKYLQEGCKAHFRQRFYTECVQMFITGNWKAKGVPESEQQQMREKMEVVSRQAIDAMNELVEGNLRLVISIARRYSCAIVPLSDLVQEGNIGLMRAVESFEYKLGHRFSTYASYWVRQAISHAINAQSRPIRMPVNILRQLAHIHHAERQFLQENGRIPTVDELGAILDLTPARIRALQKMGQQPLSLQAVAADDSEWGDLLADNSVISPHDEYARENVKNSLRMALGTLEEREREILIRRFGIMGQPVETLDQIAARFKLTSERIRQIETSALRKLRTPKANRFLDELR